MEWSGGDALGGENAASGDAVKRKVHGIFFSATGTTKTITEEILKGFSSNTVRHDLLRRPLMTRIETGPNDLVIVGMPVYSGRVPPIALKSLQHLRGKNTPAIAVVVYGNRDYDDALLELKNTLEANGFVVVAAAAFIGQHAIFPQVAAGRPDENDIGAVDAFSHQCATLLSGLDVMAVKGKLVVKGNHPYREPPPLALHPTIDASICTACNRCVAVCPTKALNLDKNRKTVSRNDKVCISCAACIHVCPTGAQAFRGQQYEGFGEVFAEKMSARREPETFL